MPGKTPAMLLAFGNAAPKGRAADEGGGESPGAMAGEAFADAVKSGDGQAIYDAFETLYRECSRGNEDEGDAESMDGEEGEY